MTTINKNTLTSEAGFSLIEAMVAIVIFVIGILGAYQLQLQATTGNALANRVTVSSNWAAYTIEELMAQDYDDLEEAESTPDGVGGLDDEGSAADGAMYVQPDGSISLSETNNEIYTIFWNIAEGNSDPTSPESVILEDVKLIRVLVRRMGGIGEGTLYSHDYYKARWPESDV